MSTDSKNITILGASTSGLATAQLATQLGYTAILVSEFKAIEKLPPALLEAFTQLPTVTLEAGGHSAQCLTHAQTVVVSPSILINAPIIQQLKAQNPAIRVCSEVAWALEQISPEKLVGIGITGTNGKTTVTALTYWLLAQSGLPAQACGNIGLPVATVVLNALQQETTQKTIAVMELSSYQLEYSDSLEKLAVSAFTNFTPDHLDWHGGLQAYQSAKKKLFVGELAPPWVVLNADDLVAQTWMTETSASVLAYSLNAENPFLQKTNSALWIENKAVWLKNNNEQTSILTLENFQLKGSHNLENLLASVGVAYLQGVSTEDLQRGIESFTAVEHRCERVLLPARPEWQLYNDSKATNPEACIKALEGFDEKSIILIAGGKAKGTPLVEWAETVARRCHTVILNGADQACFQQALEAIGFKGNLISVKTQQEAVDLALSYLENTTKDSVVLLSPATASFDQFKNFEARGCAFKDQIQAWRPQISPER
jgi:UDP-N-acetylmuramoylalanine--D-glutamate ligase